MVDSLTLALIAITALVTAAAMWMVLSQKTERMVQEAKSESEIALAIVEAKSDEQRQNTQKNEQQMLNAFKVTAKEVFEETVKLAGEEKEQSFKAVTEDFAKSLKEYHGALDSIDKGRIEREAALRENVQTVSTLGLKLSEDTQNLTRALKGDSQAQGAWGEVVVENLLQSMGFVDGRDYVKQLSETAVDKTRKRTDFVIFLPNNRQVVIDSKVSLTSYNEYVNAEDDIAANNAMKGLCKSIRGHAKELSTKNYEHMDSIQTLDFVLMVVPLESAYIAALHHDADLYTDLVGNRRVKIVSGTTIMLALMLIQELWKRENQSKNQIKLIERAGALHDQVVLFIESFTEIGFELGQATSAYEKAKDRLTEGRGNVIRQTEMLKDLGAKTKKDLRLKSGVRKLAEKAEEEE